MLAEKFKSIFHSHGNSTSRTGEPDQTVTFDSLLKVRPANRDAAWRNSLLESVMYTELIVSDKIAIGVTDGFNYLDLVIPTLGTGNKTKRLVDTYEACLHVGFGAAVREVDVAEPILLPITFGQLLGFKLTGKLHDFDFVPPPSSPPNPGDTQIKTSQPSLEYFPAVARAVMKRYLQDNGVSKPAMFLMYDPTLPRPDELVFNLFREDFPSEADYCRVRDRLMWYLTPMFGAVCFPNERATLEHVFVEL